MKKQINFTTKGNPTNVGSLSIQRILPNNNVNKVGPFVFLDYLKPFIRETTYRNGMGAHPHRGIATFSYILQGEIEHFDSAGHRAKIHSGGVQWMKSGDGVIHDEKINYDHQTESKYIHGFQFWINLPAKNKVEKPAHIAVQANEIAQIYLPAESGWLKVLLGNYRESTSTIPIYSEQFLYHIQIKAGKKFLLEVKNTTEVAAFLITDNVVLNDTQFEKGEFIEFDSQAGEIEISNASEALIDLLVFGGEEYIEPMATQGPFVMNSEEEILTAYRDFYTGKYGEINSEK
jgi:redox-sensitive bicupin YhaK (pirin superfamily)